MFSELFHFGRFFAILRKSDNLPPRLLVFPSGNMCARPSVHTHVTTQLALEGFLCNLTLAYFSKKWLENSTIVKTSL